MATLTARREQIIRVAIKLLSEGGMTALTTKNLAKAVGVTEPALYRHFNSKLDILVAILDHFERHMQVLFDRSLSPDEAVLDQIQTVYSRVFQSFSAQPALASVVFSEELFRHDKRLAERVARIMDVVEGHILNLLRSKKGRAECRADVPAKDLARVVMGSLRFIVTRWRLKAYEFDLEKEGAAFWQSLRRMMAAPAK
ncbi:MAG: TetR family transcriptional regulator [Sedimentisphaerales bacterium]|jgi:AcrR family transcriptional regulator